MNDRKASIEKMLVMAQRLTEIIDEMKARARKMYPEVYADERPAL